MRISAWSVVFLFVSMFVLLTAGHTQSPSVTGVSTTFGQVGDSVTITGTAFGTPGTVKFNGTAATVSNWAATSIVVTVPAGATSGQVVITSSVGLSSSGVNFTINPSTPMATPGAGLIVTVAGNGSSIFNGDGIRTLKAGVYVTGIRIGPDGNLYIADSSNNRIRMVSATTGIITTVAGGGSSGDGALAVNAQLSGPNDVAFDSAGNLYIADSGNSRIRLVTKSTGIITTVAGNGIWDYAGDNGPATSAALFYPTGVAVDGSGNIYIADWGNDCVRKVTTSGTISTFAGSCVADYFFDGDPADWGAPDAQNYSSSSDGGLAVNAQLDGPYSLAVDSSNNVYIADMNDDRVLKVTGSNGVITSVVGTGLPGYTGDGGAATSARLYWPTYINVSSTGTLYIGEQGNGRVRKVASGVITTLAGNGGSNNGGTNNDYIDGGRALDATVTPLGVATDATGNVYVADASYNRIRAIGTGTASVYFNPVQDQTYGVAPFPVSITSPSTGAVTYSVISGSATISGSTMTITGAGTVVLSAIQAASGSYPAATVSMGFNVGPLPLLSFTTIPGKTYGDAPFTVSASSASTGAVAYMVASGPATISGATVTITGAGTVELLASQAATTSYAPESTSTSFTVSKAVPSLAFAAIPWKAYGDFPFTVSATSASTGAVSYTVTSGPATISGSTVTITGIGTVVLSATQLSTDDYSSAMASTSFVVNAGSPSLTFAAIPTKINGAPPFTVSATSASTGAMSYVVNSGPATISGSTVTITGTGTVTLTVSQAAAGNYAMTTARTSFTVLAPSPLSLPGAGIIATVVGNGAKGYNGDGTSSTLAELNVPSGIAVDSTGNLYIADTANSRVRKVDAATGIVTTVAGTDQPTASGNGVPAISASIGFPAAVAVDSAGNLYIAGGFADRVYKVTAATGMVAAIAGTGNLDDAGDGGPAVDADLAYPNGIALDSSGNIYISEAFGLIRKITASTGIITTVAGGGSSSADGVAATSEALSEPSGIAVDGVGNFYIADVGSGLIRKVTASTGIITTVAGNGAGSDSGDGGLATSAGLGLVNGVTVDAFGNLYIATGDRLREVTASTGVITTLAGNGTLGYSGDGGAAINAEVNNLQGVAVDASGRIYLVDQINQRIRAVGPLPIPALTFGAISDQIYGASPFTVSASSASTGTITYSVVSGPATVSGSTVTITGVGTVVLGASQAATSNYSAATVSASFTVHAAVPLITFTAIPTQTYGVSPFTVSATSASTGAMTYTVVSGPATISGSTVTITGTGTVTLRAAQAAAGNYAASSNVISFTVNPATPTLAFTAITSQVYGAAPFTVSAGSVSTGAVTYTVTSGPATISDSTVTITGAGTVVLGASQAATSNYTAATTSTSFTVSTAAPTLAFTAIPTKVNGAPAFTVSATSASTGPVTYAVRSGPATISDSTVTVTGVGTVTLTASQAASPNYSAATASTSFAAVAPTPISLPAAGLISTVAGNGVEGYNGDGTPSTLAKLELPSSVALDSAGNFYIADQYNNRIRKVEAATGIITTIAGTGLPNYSGDGGPATNAQLFHPSSLALDSAGNIYLTDGVTHRIRKVTIATGIISTIVGTGAGGFSGDGGPASSAQLYDPNGIALDSAGNIYISEYVNNRIRKITVATGIITTIAGSSSVVGFSGDGGPATSAQLHNPMGVALDSAGNIYIADLNNRVRKVTAATGIITTIAGNGTAGYSGDGGPATGAALSSPEGVTVDSFGNLYIVDSYRIRMVNASTGIITTVAGNGISGYSGDGGAATGAQLFPRGVTADPQGNLYIADWENQRIRAVGTQLVVPTLVFATIPTQTFGVSPFAVSANSSSPGAVTYTVTSGPATISGSMLTILGAGSVSLHASQAAAGNYANATADITFLVNKAYPGLAFATVLTQMPTFGVAPFNVSATSSSSAAITYSVISGPATISGTTVTITGGGTVTLGASQPETANYTMGLSSISFVVLPAANPLTFLPIPDQMYGNAPIPLSVLTPSNALITYSVVVGPASIGVSPTQSNVIDPGHGNQSITYDVVLNGSGGVLLKASQAGSADYAAAIAYTSFNIIAPIPVALPGVGIISTLVGNGTQGDNGDGIFGTAAQLNNPQAVAVDSAGNIYIAEAGSGLIRKVTASTGIITTAAGGGAGGDGASAIGAQLFYPTAIALDSSGNLYIADLPACKVRKVTAANGFISTVAGAGICGDSGDGGAATNAGFTPSSVAVDSSGNLYIADYVNSRIRKVTASTGIITTLAGTGVGGYSGDGGLAAAAQLNTPFGVAVDNSGNAYIADSENNRIRKVDALTGVITTFAGGGTSSNSGDGGLATSAQISSPSSIAVDNTGNVYIAEGARIREVSATTGIITTLAGTNVPGYSGDGGIATNAELGDYPPGVAVDALGNIYIADRDNQRIRAIGALPVPVLTFAPIATQIYGDAPFLVSATSASTGTVTYTVTSGPATISGSVVTLTGTGTVVLQAVQKATPTYSSAIASTSFVVNPGVDPTLTFTPIPTQTYGVSPFAISASSASPGVITYSLVSGPAVVSGSIVTITGGGVVTLQASQAAAGIYAGATTTTSFTVNQIAATLTFTPIPTQTYGASPFTVSASSVSSGAVNYTVASGPASIVGSTVTLTGAGTVVLNATQASTADYTSSSTATSFTVLPTITLTTSAASINQGSSVTFTATLTSGATGSVAFFDNGVSIGNETIVGNTATLTISSLTAGSHLISATWGGNASYAAAASLGITQMVNYPQGSGQPGIITTIAGNGVSGYTGDGGPATVAELTGALWMATDAANNLYFCDGTARVRKITAATGVITTVAGNGTFGYSGDNQLATNAEIQCDGALIGAEFGDEGALAVDGPGNIYISDRQGARIRKVSADSGIITTIVGNGTYGYTGDGGLGTNAQIAPVGSLQVDGAGNLYFYNTMKPLNNPQSGLTVSEVRVVSASTGIISTYSNPYVQCDDPDPVNLGEIGPNWPPYTWPTCAPPFAVDAAGNIYEVDGRGAGIYKYPLGADNAYSLIAGITGPSGTVSGNTGDGGLATNAEVAPATLAIGGSNSLYFVDKTNEIRKINLTTGIVSQVGRLNYPGEGCPQQTDSKGDGCLSLDAPIITPNSAGYYAGPFAVDASGNMYMGGGNISKINAPPTTQIQPSSISLSCTVSLGKDAICNLSTGTSQTGTVSIAYPGAGGNVVAYTADLPATAGAVEQITLPTASLSAGTYPIVATYSGDATYVPSMAAPNLTISKITPTVTWPAPTPIAYGTLLSVQQLNATSSVPGTFTYNPALNRVLPVGSNTLQVTFNPTDTTNYNGPVTATQTLTVTDVTPSISWLQPAPIQYGTLLSSTQLNATANVPGTFAYTPGSGGTPLSIGLHTLSVTFTPTSSSNNTNNASIDASVSIQVLPDTPVISGIISNPAAVGTPVTIYGQNFGPSQASSTVTFNGVAATPSSWTDNSIVVAVPAGAKTGNVVVNVEGMLSNSFLLMVPASCP